MESLHADFIKIETGVDKKTHLFTIFEELILEVFSALSKHRVTVSPPTETQRKVLFLPSLQCRMTTVLLNTPFRLRTL